MTGLVGSAAFLAVLDAALRGTLILGAAFAATALMRRASASSRHLVWLAALAALPLLPLARAVVPAWHVLPATPVLRAAAAPAPVLPDARPREGADDAAAPVASSAEPAVLAAAPSAPPFPAAPPVDWAAVALLVWAAGAGLYALRLAFGILRIRWVERRATELVDDEWVHLADGLARRLRLGRIVRLLREPGATVPMTWGIFRPVVLLPGEADGWDGERRRVVLAHELAHVRRWDAATQWIAHAAVALFWFNPLVWMAARRLRQEREHACDDAVLEIGTRPADYADHLLTIVRALGSAPGPAAALAMARRSQFEGRLLAILDSAAPRRAVGRAAGLVIVAAAAASVVSLAALQPAPASAASPGTTDRDASSLVARPDAGQGTGADASGADRGDDAGDAGPAAVDARAADDARVGGLVPLPPVPAVSDRLRRIELVDAARAGDRGLYAEIIRAAEGMRDPVERRLVLVTLLRKPDLGAPNVAAVIDATRTMGDDVERRTVLTAVLARRDAGAATAAAVIDGTMAMESDAERRIVIAAALAHRSVARDATLPGALFDVLAHFADPVEQRNVLSPVLQARRLDSRTLIRVFHVVREMRSDVDKRIVLTTAAAAQRMDAGARSAYLAAARSIGSETDRAHALTAVAGQPVDPVSATRGWDSDIELTLGDGRRIEIRARDVLVGATLADVRGFRPGGSLLVEERRGGSVRRVEGVCDGDGNPVYRLTVDGRVQPFDAGARAWMAGIIREFTGA